MRKIYVDIFFCDRQYVKTAIQDYLNDIERLGGLVCPSVIMLGSVIVTKGFNAELNPVFRLFSIQRRGKMGVKVVVNLCAEVDHERFR